LLYYYIVEKITMRLRIPQHYQ